MSANFRPARHVRRLRLIAIGLFAVAAIAVILIAAGAFDPQPFGRLARTDFPGAHIQTETGETSYPLTVPWSPDAPPTRFSVRLTAAHEEGELDSGFGLALGDDVSRLVIALSPLGYVAIYEEGENGEHTDLMPWQTWPHVRGGTAENELWLDIEPSGDRVAVTARVNREILWQGEMARYPTEIGLWQATYGRPVNVEYRKLEWFADP